MQQAISPMRSALHSCGRTQSQNNMHSYSVVVQVAHDLLMTGKFLVNGWH